MDWGRTFYRVSKEYQKLGKPTPIELTELTTQELQDELKRIGGESMNQVNWEQKYKALWAEYEALKYKYNQATRSEQIIENRVDDLVKKYETEQQRTKLCKTFIKEML